MQKAKETKKNILFLLIAVFSLCLFFLPSAFNAFALFTQEDDIDEIILATMQRQNVPGVSVAIVQTGDDDEVSFDVSFHSQGYACLKEEIPVNEETFFYIASLTKAFTALGVQFLEHRGHLSLNDPINKHIEWLEFSHRSADFSMEELSIFTLLHHTSGLGNFSHSARIRPDDSPDALYQAVRHINRTRLNSRPGSQYSYASSNYIVLGFLIEQISMTQYNMSYEEFMVEKILQPLGLYNTKMFREDAKSSGVLAVGHRSGWFRARPYEASIARSHTSTGFMLSNTSDMTRWLQFHLNPETAPYPFNILIPNGHIKDATVQPRDLPSGVYHYALGWDVNYYSGRLRHSGFIANVVAEALFYQEEGIAIIVFMNSSSGQPLNLVENILAIIRGEDTGNISIGSPMQIMDIVFSTLSIFFIVLLIGLIALIIYRIFKIRKEKIKRKNLSLKNKVVLGLLILNMILLIIIFSLNPIMAGVSWSTAIAWMPVSAFTLLAFSTLSIISIKLLVVFRIIFQKIPPQTLANE
ncbi:MAG: beta-lactamase family protein [Firmicutes bacterium]|nr:beta-lactamase family protein [Bacillota bacterium]